MPQIYMILAPEVLKEFELYEIKTFGSRLIKCVEKALNIEGIKDVAFTAILAIATENEAEVQVEIRYTAGKDEYGRGEPFDPNDEEQHHLINKVLDELSEFNGHSFAVSVWCKPYYNSRFEKT